MSTVSERLELWAESHYPLIAGGIVAILLIPLIIWGVTAYGESKEKRSAAAYSEVMKGWESEEGRNPASLEKLLPALQQYVEEYDGTDSALMAKLDLASLLFQMKRYDESIKWSDKALSEIPDGNDLKPLARYQLALTYEAMGKNDEALAQWAALKNSGLSGLTREVEWRIARILTAKGDYSKADQQYDLAMNAKGDYPTNALLQAEKSAVAVKVKAGS